MTCNGIAVGVWAGAWINCGGGTPGAFDDVVINSDTVTLAADASANNVPIFGDTLNLSSYTLNIAGNWFLTSGTLSASTGAVNLNGADQSIYGSTTFYNLTKIVSAAHTLTFAAGTTQTIVSGGSLTLQGVSGQLLTLRSSATPADWNLNVNSAASQSISHVTVTDFNASGGALIHAWDGTNTDAGSGGTLNGAGTPTAASCPAHESRAAGFPRRARDYSRPGKEALLCANLF